MSSAAIRHSIADESPYYLPTGDEVEVFVNDLVVNGKEAYLARLNRIHKVLLKEKSNIENISFC